MEHNISVFLKTPKAIMGNFMTEAVRIQSDPCATRPLISLGLFSPERPGLKGQVIRNNSYLTLDISVMPLKRLFRNMLVC